MFIFRHVFSVIIVLSCFRPLAFAALLHPDEVATLRQIAKTMGAKDWNFVDPCKSKTLVRTPNPIHGDQNSTIECDCHFDNNTVCRITTLTLTRYSLPGELPTELVKLSYLRDIDFAYNYLSGKIPREWGSMKLNSISVLANRLYGEIPKELGNITSLTYLFLEANQISGVVPSDLGNLINLKTLVLSSNQLSGELPMSFAGLTNLTDFRVNDNNLRGTIPDFIQNWKQLTRLEMHASGLEGPIPSTISSLDKLIHLRISDIKGPSQGFPLLSNMTGMIRLVLRSCNISGEIHAYIWKMNSIEMLDVSFNKLVGEIPTMISTKSLKFVFLTGNNLSGNVPDSILMEGSSIDLSYNNFTWQGPEQPACRPNMNLNINMFRSSPMENNLSGAFPCVKTFSCSRYSYCSHVNCGGNDATVKENNMNIIYEGDGEVVGGTSKYYTRDKSNWGFSSTGDFMDDNDRQNTRFTTYIDSSSLSQLYATARLSPLSLTYFHYCLENGNYTVKLHFAEIQFTNDSTYSSLGKRIFDIYVQEILVWKDFNIEDEEALGAQKPVLKELSNVSVIKNILEIQFFWTGKGTTRIPNRGVYGPLISAISVTSSSKSHICESREESEDPSKIPVVVGVVSLVLCVILLVLGYLCWRRYFSGDKDIDFKGLDLQTGSFTLRQIKAATNNFDPVNKIGEGGFGSVYKGQLSDGTVIAVKQLSSKSKQGNREFVNEIGMISGLQHPNLVKLYGCCIEGNQLLLVYEYMENNCLARALFNKQGSETNGLTLDWTTRFKVCLGIARGLAFLHEESMLKIVHRDIKATNILLDINLNAKISDFGLAKLNEEENTHISTRVAGTIGYMAPEYALWGYLIDKADVYSFGVVALEIVSGKNNTSYRPENECVCLLDWAFVLQRKGSLMEIVDLKLGSEFNREETERMIKVALLCTNASPSLRPNMSEVVSMLDGQMMVHEVISDLGIYGDDLRFKPLRDHYQQMMYQNSSGNKAPNYSSDGPWVGSSSTSAQDLYQVNPDSIPSTSANDLYQVNPDSTDFKVSETSSLVSRHSN